jgi:hypothetical protein
VVNDVVAENNIARRVAGMLTGQLAEIRVVDEVTFDDYAGASVAVVAVGSNLIVIDGVCGGTDVVNGVLEDPSITSLIVADVWRYALKANVVKADIVAVSLTHQMSG